jgi:hypothetical protein
LISNLDSKSSHDIETITSNKDPKQNLPMVMMADQLAGIDVDKF